MVCPGLNGQYCGLQVKEGHTFCIGCETLLPHLQIEPLWTTHGWRCVCGAPGLESLAGFCRGCAALTEPNQYHGTVMTGTSMDPNPSDGMGINWR